MPLSSQGYFGPFPSYDLDLILRFSKEGPGKASKTAVIGSECGTGGQVQDGVGNNPAALMDTTKKKGKLGCQGSGVEVGLIQDDGLKPGSKERSVLGTTEHVLQHGVICDYDVRRRLSGLFTGSDTTFIPPRNASIIRYSRIFRCLTCEVEESYLTLTVKPFLEPVHLVIYQGIHGV
jgi:hypothetical protein